MLPIIGLIEVIAIGKAFGQCTVPAALNFCVTFTHCNHKQCHMWPFSTGDVSSWCRQLYGLPQGFCSSHNSLQFILVTTGTCSRMVMTMKLWSSRSTTSWPLSSTSRCEVKLHRTWWTTASWSRTPYAPSFALLTPTSSLFREQKLDFSTAVSRSPVREFGTVYPPHCGSLTLNLDTLNDF